MGCGGRRKCGEGIDNGSKRRIVLLAWGLLFLVKVGTYKQTSYLIITVLKLCQAIGHGPWNGLSCKGFNTPQVQKDVYEVGFLPEIEGFTPCPAT